MIAMPVHATRGPHVANSLSALDSQRVWVTVAVAGSMLLAAAATRGGTSAVAGELVDFEGSRMSNQSALQ